MGSVIMNDELVWIQFKLITCIAQVRGISWVLLHVGRGLDLIHYSCHTCYDIEFLEGPFVYEAETLSTISYGLIALNGFCYPPQW